MASSCSADPRMGRAMCMVPEGPSAPSSRHKVRGWLLHPSCSRSSLMAQPLAHTPQQGWLLPRCLPVPSDRACAAQRHCLLSWLQGCGSSSEAMSPRDKPPGLSPWILGRHYEGIYRSCSLLEDHVFSFPFFFFCAVD